MNLWRSVWRGTVGVSCTSSSVASIVILFVIGIGGCATNRVKYGERVALENPAQRRQLQRHVLVASAPSPSPFGFTKSAWDARVKTYTQAFLDQLHARNIKATVVETDHAAPKNHIAQTNFDDSSIEPTRDIDLLRRRYRRTNWGAPALRSDLPFYLRFEPDPKDDSNNIPARPERTIDRDALQKLRQTTDATSYLVFQVLYHSWFKCEEKNCVVATLEFKWIDLKTNQILWYSRGQAESSPTDTIVTLGDPPFDWPVTPTEEATIKAAVHDALYGDYHASSILEKE